MDHHLIESCLSGSERSTIGIHTAYISCVLLACYQASLPVPTPAPDELVCRRGPLLKSPPGQPKHRTLLWPTCQPLQHWLALTISGQHYVFVLFTCYSILQFIQFSLIKICLNKKIHGEWAVTQICEHLRMKISEKLFLITPPLP